MHALKYIHNDSKIVMLSSCDSHSTERFFFSWSACQPARTARALSGTWSKYWNPAAKFCSLVSSLTGREEEDKEMEGIIKQALVALVSGKYLL